jgi:hypothetical protein
MNGNTQIINPLTRIEERFPDWQYGHPKVLYGLIRSLKPDVVVEVGTYRGYGACYMAQAIKDNGRGRLFCIDNFTLTDHTAKYGDAERHLRENLEHCGVADVVTILKGNSDAVAWPERVDFAYVDGWHSARVAAYDFNECARRGAMCICLDDTTHCVGPKIVADQIRATGQWDVLEVRADNGLTICHRRLPRPALTFSQELPNNPGVDIRFHTPEELDAHFAEASVHSGLTKANYDAAKRRPYP